MDEVVKMVAEKTGLSEEVARQAVEVVVDFLKAKLPEPWGSQVEKLLAGDAPDLGDMLQKGLGGLFG